MSLNDLKAKVFRAAGFSGALNDAENAFFEDALVNSKVVVADTTESVSTTTGSGTFAGGLGVVKTIVAGLGIKLGGVTSAFLLNHYEEGTFTPILADATLADEGATYSEQTGRFTRIGRTVRIEVRLIVTGLGTLTVTDAASIIGLPFTTNSAVIQIIPVMLEAVSLASQSSALASLNPSSSHLRLRLADTFSGVGDLLISEVSATGRITVSGTYTV